MTFDELKEINKLASDYRVLVYQLKELEDTIDSVFVVYDGTKKDGRVGDKHSLRIDTTLITDILSRRLEATTTMLRQCGINV